MYIYFQHFFEQLLVSLSLPPSLSPFLLPSIPPSLPPSPPSLPFSLPPSLPPFLSFFPHQLTEKDASLLEEKIRRYGKKLVVATPSAPASEAPPTSSTGDTAAHSGSGRGKGAKSGNKWVWLNFESSLSYIFYISC